MASIRDTWPWFEGIGSTDVGIFPSATSHCSLHWLLCRGVFLAIPFCLSLQFLLTKRNQKIKLAESTAFIESLKIERNLQVASCDFWSLFLRGPSYYSIFLLPVSTYYPEPSLAKWICHSLHHWLILWLVPEQKSRDCQAGAQLFIQRGTSSSSPLPSRTLQVAMLWRSFEKQRGDINSIDISQLT